MSRPPPSPVPFQPILAHNFRYQLASYKSENPMRFRAGRAQNLGQKGSIYLVFFRIICLATNLGRLATESKILAILAS